MEYSCAGSTQYWYQLKIIIMKLIIYPIVALLSTMILCMC